MSKISGKVALITGAGQGIGDAIATRLAEYSFAIAVADINTTSAMSVADRIVATGVKAIAVEVNVADRASVFAAVQKAAEELGRKA